MKKISFGKLAGLSFLGAFVLPSVCIAIGVENDGIQAAVLMVSFVLLWVAIAFFAVWLICRWRAGAGKRAEKRAARLAIRERKQQEQAKKQEEKREAREKKREQQQKWLEEYNSPENKAKREAAKAAQRELREKQRAAAAKRKADDARAVSAVLISTDSKKSGTSAAGRAVIGGALLGPVGAIAGAASGKSKATKATFSVKYASGRTGTETVEIGSKRFNELSALLHK